MDCKEAAERIDNAFCLGNGQYSIGYEDRKLAARVLRLCAEGEQGFEEWANRENYVLNKRDTDESNKYSDHHTFAAFDGYLAGRASALTECEGLRTDLNAALDEVERQGGILARNKHCLGSIEASKIDDRPTRVTKLLARREEKQNG